MRDIFVRIYCLPMGDTFLFLAAAFLIWKPLWRKMENIPGKWHVLVRWTAAAAFALWLGTVLAMTVFTRTAGSRKIHLMPFYGLLQYFTAGPPELLRTLWMNVLLFVPGGMLLTVLLPGRWPRRRCVLLTVLLLLCVSAGIEILQYRCGLGVAETDDVLCNALGAGTGALIHQRARQTKQSKE